MDPSGHEGGDPDSNDPGNSGTGWGGPEAPAPDKQGVWDGTGLDPTGVAGVQPTVINLNIVYENTFHGPQTTPTHFDAPKAYDLNDPALKALLDDPYSPENKKAREDAQLKEKEAQEQRARD